MAAFPSVDLTDLDLAPAIRAARSARRSAQRAQREFAYTVVGLGVLTYQRFQVRRRELEASSAD